MLDELKEIIKRSSFYIELIQILTQSTFRKKNKRIRCLEPLSSMVPNRWEEFLWGREQQPQ